MWHTITHGCGHTEEQQIYGPEKLRKAKGQALARALCPTCRAAERAQEADAAAIDALITGLPTLAGTDKQIAWAERIRREKMAEFSALRAELEAAPERQPGDRARVMDALARVEREWRSRASAAQWIDGRTEMAREAVRRALTTAV